MSTSYVRAAQPGDLRGLFVERLNAGDVDGLVALYEPNAVLGLPGGQVAAGREQIRAAYLQLVEAKFTVTQGEEVPTLQQGDLALTAARFEGGTKVAEVARRQADGTWLWALDQPGL